MADSSLIPKVVEVFDKALTNGFLTFIPSAEERLQINKINVYIFFFSFLFFFI